MRVEEQEPIYLSLQVLKPLDVYLRGRTLRYDGLTTRCGAGSLVGSVVGIPSGYSTSTFSGFWKRACSAYS